MKRLLFFALILVVVPVQVFGFTATARVDRNRISEGESLTLRVIVQGGEAVVDTSVVADFKVVPRGTSTSVRIINGEYSKNITHQYVLLPKTRGRLTIPPLPVTLDGELAHTKAINVEVGKRAAADDRAGDVFARATLSPRILVPGQQAIYTFRLYSAVQISNARLQQPRFSGFSAKEAGKRESYGKVINGRSYEVTRISYVLMAEKEGDVEIEPAVVTCDIPVVDSRDPMGDPFFGNRFFSMGRHETRRYATEPFKVTVNPMPVYHGAGRFSGLVGRFSLGAGLDRDTVASGESVTLTLTVSGTGNIMDAQAPEVRVSDSFKVYDDVPEEKITLTPDGFQGDKIFKRALVPVAPGNFVLEPVELCYFSTDTGAYETVSTPSLKLSVKPSGKNGGVPQIAVTDGGKVGVGKQAVEFTGDDILALKEGTHVLVPHRAIPLPLFLTILVVLSGLLLVPRAVMVFGKKEASASALMGKRSKDCLKKAESKNISQEDFFRNLYTALVSRVLARGSVSGETLTAREVSDILSKAGHGEEKIREATAMLNDIESARYGGASFDSTMKNDLLKRAKRVVKTLGIALVCLGLFSAMPTQGRTDDSGTLFLEGVNLYKAGQFQDAAVKFERVAENGIKNGELYYNIANAYLKAGEVGPAILWYERAVRLIPLDPDLTYNLDYAKGLVADEIPEKTMDISGLLFFWEKYLPSWLVQYGALLLWFGFVLHTGVRMARKKPIFTPAGVVLFVASLIIMATAFFDYYQQSSDSHAVILANEASVRSGFSDDATELFVLHAGTKVRVERREGGFLRIAFSKDKVGWIRATAAGII
ncbi:MAG: BatD family protein [Desulfobacterium sp.]|nr:BatD family protein [Desulfobacterium sp.]